MKTYSEEISKEAALALLEACKLAEKYYLPTPVLIAIRNAIAKAERQIKGRA